MLMPKFEGDDQEESDDSCPSSSTSLLQNDRQKHDHVRAISHSGKWEMFSPPPPPTLNLMVTVLFDILITVI